MTPERIRVDLGAGKERQQDGAERGQEVDPFGRLEAEEVAAHHAQPDLDERDGDTDAD
jgi:hypothetical protein